MRTGMSPKALRVPLANPLCPIDEESTGNEISLHDYIIVNDECVESCVDCEYMNISDVQALQICLQEEKRKSHQYKQKLHVFMRKHQQTLRQLKYQQTKIEQLTKRLSQVDIDNRCSNFTVTETQLQDDFSNSSHLFKQSKLEFVWDGKSTGVA